MLLVFSYAVRLDVNFATPDYSLMHPDLIWTLLAMLPMALPIGT